MGNLSNSKAQPGLNPGPNREPAAPLRPPADWLGSLASTCVQGLVESPQHFRKLLWVSGSRHARFTLSLQGCQPLPHHVSAFLNSSSIN